MHFCNHEKISLVLFLLCVTVYKSFAREVTAPNPEVKIATSSTKRREPLWQQWGRYFADAHPDQFPSAVLKDVPLTAKAGFLSSFVNGIISTFTDSDMWEITHDNCYFYEGVPDGDSCQSVT